MKVALLGDLHLRNTVPKSRKETYVEEMWKKMRYISAFCEDEDVKLILQPGDFFHTAKQPLEVLIPTAQLLKQTDQFVTKIQWLTVLGNHDMAFHQKNSPYISVNLLAKAGLVKIADEKPINFYDADNEHHVFVYGTSYGDSIPELVNEEGIHILLIHAMIIKDKKIWEQQDKFLYSQHLLKRNKFDLIVAGDNHNFFTDMYRGRFLVNCGSLMRSNIDQQDHKPCFFIYDTSAKSLTKQLLPCKEDVFIHETKQEKQDDFQDLFSSMIKNNQEDISIDFRKNVEMYMEVKGIPEPVKKLIKEIVYV